ncbi:MAG: hypothetical protein WBP13_12525 [Methylophilaceae bacterium]
MSYCIPKELRLGSAFQPRHLGVRDENIPKKFAVLLCLCFVTFNQACAETENHSHHKHESVKPSLDHGKKWSTDEPLRKGMETLRMAFAKHQVAIHKGELSNAEYEALGEKLENEVGNIVSQCS